MAKPKTAAAITAARARVADRDAQGAVAILMSAARSAPRDPAILLELARTCNRALRDPHAALSSVQKLLKLAPASAAAQQEACETFCRLGHRYPALLHARRAIKLAPKNTDTLYVAATAFQQYDLFDDAIACMDTALSLRPDHLQSQLLLAKSLREQGNLARAESICRSIFVRYPDSLANLSIWHLTCKQSADDPIYLHIRDDLLARMRDLKNHELPQLLKILGKAENDVGRYDAALQSFTEAKRIEATKPHDRGVALRYTSAIVNGLSRADYFGAAGPDHEQPVFIVGMPRSGSTLLEQMLDRHPAIAGISESPLIRNIARKHGANDGNGAGMVALVRNIAPDLVAELSSAYLAEATDRHPGARRIVDKNLHNF